MSDRFINPYTFIPLPDTSPSRTRPNGHQGDPSLLSGSLRLSITAGMPVLIRSISRASEGSDASPGLPTRPDGSTFIPGSSLKGALRSLHETLAGGCFRVFDDAFTPVYRQLARYGADSGLQLAVVTQHDSADEPPEVELLDTVLNSSGQSKGGDLVESAVHHDCLERLNTEDAPLRSGQRFTVRRGEKRFRPHMHRDDGGDWILYLSDTGGREYKNPYYGYIGKVTGTRQRITDDVWARFRAAVAGADELRTSQRQTSETEELFVPVKHSYRPQKGDHRDIAIGYRYRASERFQAGQPIWVRTAPSTGDNPPVVEVRLARIWRTVAVTPSAGERADGFTPCTTHEELCPSCRVFGSVDPVGDHEGAQQRAYRGHVRFGDARATDVVSPLPVTLPPLAQPRPGSGQFYLVNDQTAVGNAGKIPLARWGSAADNERPRRLRGRKYYWHTPTPDGQQSALGTARQYQRQDGNEMVAPAAAFPAGTTFTADITFTDLDEAQVGGLLATLEPGSVLDAEEPLHHIGGGRPLGYGSCRIAIDTENSRIWRSGTRYGGDGAPASLDDRSPFLDAFIEATARDVRSLWPHLAKVLSPDAVDPSLVWYPPGATWNDRATKTDGEKKFDQGFAFWQQTSGEEHKSDGGTRKGYPLQPLPDVSESDQKLPVVTETQPQDLSDQRRLDGDR
ncbi:CRISPR-associated protein [Haloechinothrix alba]|uniref:CRISPR-associated protein n=1 Tax=Haloechinothrix alba TaxID=664784 RepID=A0A238ZYH2_9PSEU|nr:TIGR03986 family CRISPR-associated RAMP protein [Haloechinothrix alba]SNR87834.1 CRISPR-associated protein [Haloechinothrix alba]